MVKWYGKYGKKGYSNRYGQYERKVGWIVKWYE
jgi:hypothetical protein